MTQGIRQPLTDTQLRALAVAISGTVALDTATLAALESITVVDGGGSLTVDGTVTANAGTGTMAVSAASLPLPSGAAQDGTDITTPTAMPAGGAGIRGWLSAIWTKLNGSIAVTGTFWQATQPVSGTVTANAGTGTMAVTGSGTAGSPAAGVQTVQGISGGIAQPSDVNDSQTQKVTYLAGSAATTGALVAATAKTVLSLHHAAAATKTVKIRRIDVALVATTATAGNVTLTINRGTAAPSVAGTAVTPAPGSPADAAAEVTVQTNPTITAATVVAQYGFGTLAASGAIANVTVYRWDPAGQQKPLTLRAGVLDSIALSLTSSATQTVTPYITVYLTEE